LSNNFNKPIKNLPKTLKYLIFGNNFNQQIDNLPCSIIHLEFKFEKFLKSDFLRYFETILDEYSNFNKPIDNLPNSIIYLIFDDNSNFNQPIDNLPNTIMYLKLGNEFNKPIDNLPNSIIQLTLGYEFNQSINNLPHSITHLTLGYKFNKSINNLPNSITHLIFDKYNCFDQKIFKFPNSIIIFKSGTNNNDEYHNDILDELFGNNYCDYCNNYLIDDEYCSCEPSNYDYNKCKYCKDIHWIYNYKYSQEDCKL
jgi:hypothetical protein